MEARYLGDSVYIREWQGMGGIILTTDSHREHDAGNTIFIEPSVLQSLLKWIDEYKKERGIV